MLTRPASRARSPHPSLFLLLNLPHGLPGGYITVVLPFLVARAGLPVLTAASMVAVALSPKALKILWAPLADIGLTLKKWYAIGASLAGATLLLQSFMPITRGTVPFIAAALFVTECGANLLAAPLGALMAEALPDHLKGRAAGWYQLGGHLASGVGGGGGLWLAIHTGRAAGSGAVLGLTCISCILGLNFLDEPARRFSASVFARLKTTGLDLWQMLKSREGVLVAALTVSPIGVSGVDEFWSAVAKEWHASAATVVSVTGFASAAIAAFGCLLAGWWADRGDRRRVYLATGTFLAAATMMLALGPHVPRMFVVGTLAQKLFIGMSDAAVCALFLQVIGRSAPATKFAFLGALSNVSLLYMTVISGWVHDHWGTVAMLLIESFAALVCIGAGAALLLTARQQGRAAVNVRAV